MSYLLLLEIGCDLGDFSKLLVLFLVNLAVKLKISCSLRNECIFSLIKSFVFVVHGVSLRFRGYARFN